MKKDEQLVLNKRYKLGKKVFWFLFFKKNIKFFIFLILSFTVLYFINKPSFKDWVLSLNTVLSVPLLNLWIGTLLFCLILLMFVSIYEKYAQHKFMLGEHSFHIRRGFFMIKEKVIPYRHIQNVDLEQPWHYRIIGLSKLNITTARMDNFEDEKTNLIPIIDKNIARKLSDFLIKQGVMSHTGNIVETKDDNVNNLITH